MNNEGDVGELLVSNFFDNNFSKAFSFPNPKTKDNDEIADVLIWLNRTVYLIEVKTRSSQGTAPTESWAHTQIKKAHTQILKNYNRIKLKEKIFLNNDYYHTELDCENLVQVIGLIVLVYDDNAYVEPTTYLPNLYKSEIPLHVLAWKDLELMIEEIDTVPDFTYYLQDRYEYLKTTTISTEQEMNILGYYKLNSNKFPIISHDFSNEWENYKESMLPQIQIRNEHNLYSTTIDKLGKEFLFQKKLWDGIPIGLYFSWELGNLSRRERAYFGEKLYSVFKNLPIDTSSRQFSVQSSSTQNWLLFHFTNSSEELANKEINSLSELKLIKEVHFNHFEYGIYSFSFNLPSIHTYQELNINHVIMMSADYVQPNINDKKVQEAIAKFGDKSSYSGIKVEEFIDA